MHSPPPSDPCHFFSLIPLFSNAVVAREMYKRDSVKCSSERTSAMPDAGRDRCVSLSYLVLSYILCKRGNVPKNSAIFRASRTNARTGRRGHRNIRQRENFTLIQKAPMYAISFSWYTRVYKQHTSSCTSRHIYIRHRDTIYKSFSRFTLLHPRTKAHNRMTKQQRRKTHARARARLL